MTTRFFTTTFFLLAFITCWAQVPSPLIFSRITKKQGLASNTIFHTIQDKDGFLWVASQNGLQRYDGHRFITIRHSPSDTTTIPYNAVNYFFFDSKGRFWLMFDRQAGIFNPKTFKFTEIRIAAPVMMTRKIMEDSEGRVVLLADSKQFIFDEATQSFNTTYPFPALPAGYAVTDMVIDPSTGLYWLTGKQGSLIYDPKKKQISSAEQNLLGDPALAQLGPVKNARYPFISKDGTWWMVDWIPFSGPAPVLYRYNKAVNQLQRYEKIRPYKSDSYYEIWHVFEQSNGTIWVHGMGLLAYFDKTANRFVHINSNPFAENGIEFDMVNSLYEDKEKNVWVCTNKGLYRFNMEAQVFRNFANRRPNDTTVYRNAVSNIVQTQQHGIWVGTWGGGVFSYNDQFQPIPNPVTSADPVNKGLHASYLIQRRNGEIWIGTQTGDIKIFDPSVNKTFTVSQSLLRGKIITQLLEDQTGNVWIGSTVGMLVKCDKGNWKDTASAFKSVLTETADIMNLYEDRKGHLWVSTATDGLYRLDTRSDEVVKHYTTTTANNDGLLSTGAADVLQYDDSTYLIASEGLCILNDKTQSFKYLVPADGLPEEHITNLLLDKQNRLWVALDAGLYRLNIDNKLYVSYDAADGITNDVFQVSSSTMLKDGRIVLGTPVDMVVFDPQQTIDRREVPPVTITGVTVGNSQLLLDSVQRLNVLTLTHDNTFTRIDVSTLRFHGQYYIYYKLEGLDKTWKQVTNNEIVYQVLPPGEYTLKLKARNSEGEESKAVTAFTIDVQPPFWKTWWFYSLIALTIAGLFFWFDQQRIKRKTAILKMRSDIADELHQDINATLSNITILSEMAKMKAGREPEKSMEFIDQIHAKSQNMTMAMDDILWSIDPQNDSMENFMLRFREYIDALKTQYNTPIDILVDKKAEQVRLKMKERNNVFSLFKSGITNMLKVGATQCRIHITYEKHDLVYTLEFDTEHADMEQLNNVRQRTELAEKLEDLGATLDFSAHKAKAVFVLTIPVRGTGF